MSDDSHSQGEMSMNRREFLASFAGPLVVLSAGMDALPTTGSGKSGFARPPDAKRPRQVNIAWSECPPARTSTISQDSLASAPRLKKYPLHYNPSSADISPDEQFVVTECPIEKSVAHPGAKRAAAIVQLWNFREDRLIAEMPLQPSESQGPSEVFVGSDARIVRFSPDGALVLSQIGQVVHVLRANDLTEVRTIPLSAPEARTQVLKSLSGHKKFQVEEKPYVQAMEISPSGSLLAVLWVREELYGRIDIYEIASARHVLGWDTPPGWVYFTQELRWEPDEKRLVVAIPNGFPCSSPGSEPDVFVFDVETGIVARKFRTGMLTGSIALAPDHRVLAVDMNCLGIFKNHHPKLRVFDLATGKRLRDVSGRGSGVRYFVSTSADGSRFLAFTGRIKPKFDWVDFVPDSAVVDETFTVWNLKDYGEVAVSQNIPGLKDSRMRISPKGHYAVSYGAASFVYDLS